jgi:hypothetical protein
MCFSYAKPLLLGKSGCGFEIGVTAAMPIAATKPFTG